MKKRPLATIQCVTRTTFPGPTFPPLTGSAEVAALRISQKNIRTSIHLLGSAFKLPTQTGERCEVSVVFNLNQEVDIFGVLFVGGN